VLQKYHGQAGKGAITFSGELRELLQSLWPQYDGFVCIMATGIVVRLAAPLLDGKEKDPAVVVMDDAGRFAISLLSGHLGGANELAQRCAFITGAREVITTATDVNGLPSFDMLARENGWQIEDLSRIKILNSLLLDGEEIAVVDTTGLVRPWFHGRGRLVFHETAVGALRSQAKGFLLVSNSFIPPQLQSESLLVLRPRNLALGIGCNSGTSAAEIEAVVTGQLKRLFLSSRSLACVATATAKAEEPGLLEFAHRHGLPLHCFGSDELNAVAAPSPLSEHAMKAIGAVGVAEPSAILASRGGKLLLKKVKDGNVTLAIAEME
jgi:cobalt-precorrin 5A hydrolase